MKENSPAQARAGSRMGTYGHMTPPGLLNGDLLRALVRLFPVRPEDVALGTEPCLGRQGGEFWRGLLEGVMGVFLLVGALPCPLDSSSGVILSLDWVIRTGCSGKPMGLGDPRGRASLGHLGCS